MVTFCLNGLNSFISPHISLTIIERPQLLKCSSHLHGIFIETMFPRLYLLNLMCFGMDLDAIRAEGFETVDVDTKIGELFSWMFHTLQS